MTRVARDSRPARHEHGTHHAPRVLHPKVLHRLRDYQAVGGLHGSAQARQLSPESIRTLVLESGLRGRGGAGFPTGTKWMSVAEQASTCGCATVIVNGAEGEPGTFKDRSILRRNPFEVIEGAFIAARAVHADRIVIALKRSFTLEVKRVRDALSEMRSAGVLDGSVGCAIYEGPDEYLYGEETALIETLDGRGPFPRVVPPYRQGLLGRDPDRPIVAGPALVNNVETIANLPKLLARGADWFRAVGTPESPGTVVCTVTGDVNRQGVGEVRMGTPLRTVITDIGRGASEGRPVKAVLSGVANPIITGELVDVPVSHEGMASIGCGLGSAGFMVFDDRTDMVALAAGVSRFLAVESCGQCTPCKLDGLTLAAALARLAASNATCRDLETVEKRVGTVSYGARCYLAVQHETVLSSILRLFREEFEAHLAGSTPPARPVTIAELVEIDGPSAGMDTHHLVKQSDWTFAESSSASTPVELRARHRSPVPSYDLYVRDGDARHEGSRR